MGMSWGCSGGGLVAREVYGAVDGIWGLPWGVGGVWRWG